MTRHMPKTDSSVSPETSPQHPIATLVVVCLALFMLLLDVTIVAVALPDIQTSLDADLGDLQWIVDAYTLPLAAVLLTAAVFGDRIGRKRLFLGGMAIFTASSLGCALSETISPLIELRGAQGLGAALLLGVSLPLISAAFPDPVRRARAIGVYAAVMGLAIASGPLVGGLLVNGAGWEWIFLVNVPIGVIALVVGAYAIGESRTTEDRKNDWAGTLLATVALILAVIGIIEGNDRGWTSAYILSLLISAGVITIVFVLWEFRSPHPMLDLRLLVRPEFTALCLGGFIAFATITASANFVSLYFMNVLDLSALDTGLRLLPMSGTALVVAPMIAVLQPKAPAVVWLIGGTICIAVGCYVATGVAAGDTWTHYAVPFFLTGAGLGIVIPVTSQAAINMVTDADAGMATGTVGAARQLGTVVGVAVLGSLFSSAIADKATAYIRDALSAQQPGTGPTPEDADRLVNALESGAGMRVVDAVPDPAFAQLAAQVARSASDAGINTIFGASAVAATFGAALVALLGILQYRRTVRTITPAR